MVAWLITPRFDSPASAAINVAALVVTLVALVLLVRDRRSVKPWPWFAFLVVGAYMSFDRIIAPIGALLILFALWAEWGRPERQPASVQAPKRS